MNGIIRLKVSNLMGNLVPVPFKTTPSIKGKANNSSKNLINEKI